MFDKNLVRLLGEKKKLLVYVILLMFVGLVLNLALTFSFVSGLFYAFELPNIKPIMFLTPGLVFVFALIGRFLISYFTGVMKDSLGREAKKQLRRQIYDKILSLGVESTNHLSMASLTQVSVEGIEQLDLYFSVYLPQFFYSMIAPFILFIICAFIDWKASVVLLACVPLIPVSIIAVSKYAKKIFAKYWGKYTSMGDSFLDSLHGLRDLKIYQADGKRHKLLNDDSEEFRKITMKVLVMQLASVTIMDLVAFGGAGVGVAVAIYDAKFGTVAPNLFHSGNMEFVALFMILVSVEFFLPLRALGSAFHIAMNGLSAGKKILDFLKVEDPKWGELDCESSEIYLDNVNFKYNDSDQSLLTDINLSIKKGLTSIVGESGSGKSTIVNLIMGSLRTSEGLVKVGQNSIYDYKRESYYCKLAIVSYNSYIFNDSIRNNFLFAKKDASDEEIMEYLDLVNLRDFVLENGGLDSHIKEDAENISGGQKQRLSLAINLIANKDIYIFDEATSNIDIESEKIIMENIERLSHDKTILLISHRLENVVNSDVIYFLKDGKILEQGKHHELLSKENSAYKDLYLKQKNLESSYMNKETSL